MGTLIGLLVMLVSGVIGLALLAVWIWALVHAVTNRGLRDTEKIMWVLIIIVVPLIGVILYYFIGRPRAGAAPPLQAG
ncbi:MAG: PLDc N-terminal domain-containing protein [Verrucomicrobiae bacterium]|nr:PLDc N-terminal domain-containing protein [Verrucomicrobiae bacterium]MDW7980624.1 PLDc N-terminal domain-containing protein [Verrucomicrobiales bacterium]